MVVPHPDDESLSTGGLIAHQSGLGRRVVVIAVTDGDAAYNVDGDPLLARVRRAEQTAALHELAAHPIGTVRLGCRDGHVADAEQRIVTTIRAIAKPGDLVVTPWHRDHHSDHIAASRATTRAIAGLDVELVFSLFWAWHHASPNHPGFADIVHLPLRHEIRQRKARALACHRSQLDTDASHEPILHDRLTEPARWSNEYYLRGMSPQT